MTRISSGDRLPRETHHHSRGSLVKNDEPLQVKIAVMVLGSTVSGDTRRDSTRIPSRRPFVLVVDIYAPGAERLVRTALGILSCRGPGVPQPQGTDSHHFVAQVCSPLRMSRSSGVPFGWMARPSESRIRILSFLTSFLASLQCMRPDRICRSGPITQLGQRSDVESRTVAPGKSGRGDPRTDGTLR
jgi:hypothetical protein